MGLQSSQVLGRINTFSALRFPTKSDCKLEASDRILECQWAELHHFFLCLWRVVRRKSYRSGIVMSAIRVTRSRTGFAKVSPRIEGVSRRIHIINPHQRYGYRDSPFARIYCFYTRGWRGGQRWAPDKKRKWYLKMCLFFLCRKAY